MDSIFEGQKNSLKALYNRIIKILLTGPSISDSTTESYKTLVTSFFTLKNLTRNIDNLL